MISVANTGQSSETGNNNDAYLVAASDSGRHVLFSSRGRDIVSTPNNGNSDSNVYLRDTQLQTTEFINVDGNGSPSSDNIFTTVFVAAVSDSGTVVFCSQLDDLVVNDNNGFADVFYFDGISNTRISVTETGGEITDSDCSYRPTRFAGVDISSNGSLITFVHESDQLLDEDSNETSDVFLYQVGSGELSLVAKTANDELGDGDSHHPQLSSNQQLLFLSSSGNLTANPTSRIHNNLFRYFISSDQLVFENIAMEEPIAIIDGVITPKISSDQNTVLFASYSTDLIDGDLDDELDLFLFNRQTSEYTKVGQKVSVSTFTSNALYSVPSYFGGGYDLSSNGRFVVFESRWFQPISTLSLGDSFLFIYDTMTGQYTQLITGAERPKVNNDGKVVFSSPREDIIAGDTNGFNDVFIYDYATQIFSLVSEGLAGNQANNDSEAADIAGEGANTWVTFVSRANNLIATDVNGMRDVFYRQWPGGTTMRASRNINGIGTNGFSTFEPKISENTENIIYSNNGDNLTAEGNPDGELQLFHFNRTTEITSLVTKNRFDQPSDSGLSGPNLWGQYSISDSGRYTSFLSNDNDLVADSLIGIKELFLYDRQNDAVEVVSFLSSANPVNQDSFNLDHDLVEDMSVNPPLLGIAYVSSLAEFGESNPNRNLFLYQDNGPDIELNMTIVGQGSVNGSLSYACNSQCTDSYGIGTDLFLVATPSTGYEFVGWTGDACHGNQQSCQLSMDENYDVKAVFVDPSDIIFKNSFE